MKKGNAKLSSTIISSNSTVISSTQRQSREMIKDAKLNELLAQISIKTFRVIWIHANKNSHACLLLA